jgi:P-type E1-E2 ATPase
MAIVQTVVRLTGGIVVAIFHYISDVDLYQLMIVQGTVDVVRNGAEVTIDKTDVVPGDIVRLTPGKTYFDMAILRSNHLLVDESTLTGETHPVAKHALDTTYAGAVYNPSVHKSSTIFAGTTILECKSSADAYDMAIVTQTGSFTAKGEMLSDVLSYERHRFKFDTEMKLVLTMLLIEMIILSSYVLKTIEAGHWVYSWFYTTYFAGTVLPPLLPTVFVVSFGISAKRL